MAANSEHASVFSPSLRRFGLVGLLAAALGCEAAPSQPAPEAPHSDASASRKPADPAVPSADVATVSMSGAQLFLQHCGACHGDQGDGLGRAALFLFPKPRDFRGGRFKLASSANSVPVAEDIEAVLVRGMPGSSMPSWAHLPKEQRALLVEEVLRMFREGAKERYVKSLRDDEGLSEEELAGEEVQQDIADTVAAMTTPEPAEELPEMGAVDETAIARGKEIYVKQSCHSCHGNEGKGDGVQAMFDETGLPTRPRDLTQGIYKGGHDVPSLYRRIFYGMPGTPMPSSQTLTQDQIVDLSHFLRSLSTESQREAAVMRRVSLQAKRVGKVTDDPVAESWSQDDAATVQLMPLWWRDGDFRVQVQARHDGKNLAVRLTWRDATQNAAAVRPDEFEDMAAIELYEGDAEPFLGMGAATTALDLWQWRAGREATGAEDQLSDEYPFDTEEYRRLAGGKPLPDFITARAGGNPLATREDSASNLTAGGHGSLTFRPKASQVVTAQAVWSDGQWSVVFMRPLQVSASEGLTLRSGQHYSGAFAIWDGEARDRAGQKLISMWNDLDLE
ncbi:MAG: ethylbenzene dehydrogenase-related protein [Planctomycetia bacterium]|nr:ethylbenzene dehydrogenase-related protein [Planctomycetia bacterium]